MEDGKHLISCFSITGIKIRPRADRGGVVSLSQGLCGGWVCVEDEECKEESDHVASSLSTSTTVISLKFFRPQNFFY